MNQPTLSLKPNTYVQMPSVVPYIVDELETAMLVLHEIGYHERWQETIGNMQMNNANLIDIYRQSIK